MILPTSSWLWNKYVPKEFDIKYLNFGDYDGKLFRGEYISLAEEQEGERHAWAKYIYDYVKKLRDKYVIVGCDDFPHYQYSKGLSDCHYLTISHY